MALIELKEIGKTYKPSNSTEVHVLRGVNLTIEKGDFIAVMGPSGAGKSTLLHILGLLDYHTSGEYWLDGNQILLKNSKNHHAIRNEKMGFVLQEFGLIPDNTVVENVSIPLLFNKKTRYKSIKPKVLEVLEPLGILDLQKKKVSQISGGQRQRVAIARALINKPEIIFADEPTGSLDSATSEEIIQIFKDLNSKGNTIVIVTHNNEIALHCKRIIKIIDGRIEEN